MQNKSKTHPAQNLLLRRFWKSVTNKPNATTMVLKNPNTGAKNTQPFVKIDWASSGAAVATIMSYLRKQGVKAGDSVAILAWNCPELVWADIAIQTMGAISVAIYPNNGPDQVNYIIKNCGATICFVNDAEQKAKIQAATPVDFCQIPAETAGVPVRPFHEWFIPNASAGTADHPVNWSCVKSELDYICGEFGKPKFCGIGSDSVAMLIYTSGSTGEPKGVCLTHGNVSAALSSLTDFGYGLDPKEDFYVSYLPLAHVYERVNGTAMCLWHSVPIGFATVDAVRNEGALEKFRPTLMAGVPAVWRSIQTGAVTKIEKTTGLAGVIARWALRQKKPGLRHYIADKLVFRKVRAGLGGRMRLRVVGGAASSVEMLEFYEQVGLKLTPGYGLSETTGGIVTMPNVGWAGLKYRLFGRWYDKGLVGKAVPGCQVKIVPREGVDEDGEGEIWLKGPLVFGGYWKLPEENKKAFSPDGWFKTGDLGRLNRKGFLKITGRIKGQMKTDGGKYVAREKVEKVFEAFPIVQCMVPVGDNQKFIAGLIFVNQAVARKLVNREVPAGVDAAAWLAEQPEVVKAVADAVAGANEGLERWEQLKKWKVMPVEARVDNNILTPTLKIRSDVVVKMYKDIIATFYTG